jgi:hypothetical protein
MMAGGKDDCPSIHSVILRGAALLVPRGRRAEWLSEWKSELWYVMQESDCVPQNLSSDSKSLIFCLGAFKDAIWIRRNDRNPDPPEYFWLQSPLVCLSFLAAIAVVAMSFFFRSSGPYSAIVRAGQYRAFIPANLVLAAIAFLVLPVTTSFALGEFPSASHSPARIKRFRRTFFLGIKFALILSIVSCATLDFAPIIIFPQVALAGYLLAFRWALIDQRRRCPVCLRLLTSAARIGQPGQILLESYGIEYVCIKGHGSLQVPEILTTYSTQRWVDLDSSCADLSS